MKCPACELPLASGPDPSCSSAPVHRAAAIELGRYALLVATVEGELQAVRVAARRLPVLVSCGDCSWFSGDSQRERGGGVCDHADRADFVGDTNEENAPPEWCPMRGKS